MPSRPEQTEQLDSTSPSPSNAALATGDTDFGEVMTRALAKSQLFGEGPPRIGRYIVLEAIGSGAMGTVFAAYDDKLDRKIAIKVLRQGAGGSGARLLSEARALARVVHPNVVAVHDVGEHGGRVYIAMEFVRGEDLRAWMSRERPWEETLATLMQAGRGLAAAHGAGILHRDFKPENAIVGEDGTVRVVDFGLALTEAGGSENEVTGRLPVVQEVGTPSLRGAIAGTPPYMPFEQLVGDTLDARADQFAWCVALFEALYGERPYAGRTIAALITAVEDERITEIEAGEVPRWLRAIVVRGLARDRDARWPSMAELLGAIEAELRPRRPMWKVAMPVSVAAAGVVAVVALPDDDTPSCNGADETVAVDWSPQTRAAAGAAFAEAEPEYGPDAWRRVDAEVDAFAAQWRDRYRYFCEATHVRHELSAELLDQRMRCLQRRWRRAATLIGVFADADAKTVERALGAVQGLPSPGSCEDEPDPSRELPVPEAVKEEVEAIDLSLEESVALEAAGRYDASAEIAEAAVQRADATEFVSVRARALERLGETLSALSRWEESVQRLREAYLLAHEARLDDLTRKVAYKLTFAIGTGLKQFDEAILWSDLERAGLKRQGDRAPPEHWFDHHRTRAGVYQAAGRTDEAIEMMREALASAEQGGTDDLRLAVALNNFAVTLAIAGRSMEAEEPIRRAVELRRRLQGPIHPMTIQTTNTLIGVLKGVNRFEDALAVGDELVQSVTEAYGPDHLLVARVLGNRAAVLAHTGPFDRALADHDRVLEIYERIDPASLDVAAALRNRAFLYHRKGRTAEARADLERALGIFEAKLPPGHFNIADTLADIGLAMHVLGEEEQAAETIGRAVELLREHSSGTRVMSTAQRNLAEVLRSLGRNEEALEVEREVLQRLLGFDPVDRLEIGITRRNLATSLHALGRHVEARKEILAALEDLEAGRAEPQHLAQAYRNLAHVEHAMGSPRIDVQQRVDKALELYDQSTELYANEADALRRWWTSGSGKASRGAGGPPR